MYIETLGREYVTHNVFLHTIFKYGVFGLFLFILLLWGVVLRLFRCKSFNLVNLLFTICCVVFLSYGMLHSVFNIGVFWFGIFIIYNIGRFSDERQFT